MIFAGLKFVCTIILIGRMKYLGTSLICNKFLGSIPRYNRSILVAIQMQTVT